ncbi:MAG: glycoside hydrolase family 28 [Anaerocolumna sp.]|nr:glycoside hydrolase family 28 [Anaerocolumna sp.]
MNIKIISLMSRYLTFEIERAGIYETEPYEVYLNNQCVLNSNRIIETIYDLQPGCEYIVTIKSSDETYKPLVVTTPDEYVTLDVKEFGAKGDGIQDDTPFIQAAILSCPSKSRVYIPEGIYKVSSIFLKSDLNLEISKNAVLSAFTNREKFPILPGIIQGRAEEQYNLGSWEGDPLDAFSGIITGIGVDNVTIYGEGVIDGCASFDNWWNNPKVLNIAYRPRMLFLNSCSNIKVTGITFMNAPAWNVHPYFSKHLKFYNIRVISPEDSCNTDGLNPESCEDVEIAGCFFSVGDDCIAVKSGKIYMGKKYKVPSNNIVIRQCYMRDGHGAVTLGSEIGAGVKNIIVRECKFYNTDRGLRIKLRRGRGEDCVIDAVWFDNIQMDQVKVPFVLNSFYFCDPDGKTEYVRSKEKLSVDDRTPHVKNLQFTNINCENSHFASVYFYGLPEKKIQSITMENIRISFAKEAQTGVADMMDGCEPSCKQGIFLHNIEKVHLKNVRVEGYIGEPLILNEIDELIQED